MKYLLEVDSVVKFFGDRPLLTDVSLSCETGDVIGVFGKNGSGKSTLLKIIFGVLSAQNKFVRVAGKVSNYPYSICGGLSYLPQHSFLPKGFSVKKCIRLMVPKYFISEFMDDTVIATLISNKTSELSYGELRYLQIKLLLFTPGKFCLLDEPFTGISPVLIENICDLIKKTSQKKGIIITDHNYHYLLPLVNKIYLLEDSFCRCVKSRDDLVKNGYIPS